jgi:DNA-binding MarR family transcriptional regulator
VTDDAGSEHEGVGAWAKRYYFANRAVLESSLRPWNIGTTQWYVLYQLANMGPTMQRDLAQILHLERATLSGVVATLVRKGLVEQVPGSDDQRQRMLHLTEAGAALWKQLPDPVAGTRELAFGGEDPTDLEIAVRVLKDATRRLEDQANGSS